MVSQVVDIMSAVFGQCLVWFQSLIDAVDGMYFILAAFAMVLVAGLIVYPIRGTGFRITGGQEFTRTVINDVRARKRPVVGFGRRNK